ncbi:hypothetical protein FC34_GL001219 [Lacticaseibacillus brantae DSM 23927]|uniref:Glycosyltransferase RgtA/B/C/D-like domain-containing protein n=1 Tax=Lacticaseibacillus brantae DSM 23927 TaxID=1423727 RepID=A0A0R2AZD8_9LACO|nr:hypothetical protein FC34_GL001219 [Lacticaseibacillus brantae DSM 23927]
MVGVIANTNQFTGPAIALVAVGIIIAIYLSGGGLNQLSPKSLLIIVLLICGLMLGGQILVLNTQPVTVFHDPFRMLAQADQLAANHLDMQTTYFLRNPNNIPLTYFLSLWLRATTVFGLTTNVSVSMLNLLILDGFIALLLWTIWQISHRNTLVLGALAFSALTPFAYTYYAQVFYSDTPSLLIILIVIRLIMFWPTSRPGRFCAGIALVLTVMLGTLIKPNLIVLIPAMLLVLVVLWRKHVLKASHFVIPLLLVLFGFGLSRPANSAIISATHYTPDIDYTLPVTHWILMGMNQDMYGEFDPKESAIETALPTYKARQQYTSVQIKKQVQKLGLGGLFRLWATKMTALLDARTIQSWYNGGFRSSPSWYLAHAQTFRRLTGFSYAAATIVLFIFALVRLLLWRPDFHNQLDIGALLAIITALGYIAFHTLVWETEPRYGQIVLPLLWMILAVLPKPVLKQASYHILWPSLAWMATGLILVGLAYTTGQTHPRTTVVAAQRSQLSEQYQAKPMLLTPANQLSQIVDLHGPASYFSVQTYPQSGVSIHITNLTTKHRYSLSKTSEVQRISRALPAGRYEITVTNPTRQNQPIDVVTTANYQLAPQPLRIDGDVQPLQSLIYTVIHSAQPD